MGELEQSLTVSEFIEWQAYDRLDPFGGFRTDLQTAHLLYAKYGDKNAQLSDFLPIDPMPMTDEMREIYELHQAKKQAEKETQALIAMFERLEK